HFRLTGTRDYGLPPERCVMVEADGVTLSVDVARSDLLLETELPRFAEAVAGPSADGRRQYPPTPAAAAGAGVAPAAPEEWFAQRTGGPLSAAGRLLMTGSVMPAPELKRHLVLHVATEELADGLVQWPATRDLIAARLGPTALAVAEGRAEELKRQMRLLG